MTQEQLDLLVSLMRAVIREQYLYEQGLRHRPGGNVENTYEYSQCVRHLVKVEP